MGILELAASLLHELLTVLIEPLLMPDRFLTFWVCTASPRLAGCLGKWGLYKLGCLQLMGSHFTLCPSGFRIIHVGSMVPSPVSREVPRIGPLVGSRCFLKLN